MFVRIVIVRLHSLHKAKVIMVSSDGMDKCAPFQGFVKYFAMAS